MTMRKKRRYGYGYIKFLTVGTADNNGNLTHYITIKTKSLMALSLSDTQQAIGGVTFVDGKGNTTDVADGAVTVTSSNEGVFTAVYDDPSNQITVKATGPGVATLSIKATSQSGADLPFEDTAIEVRTGDAVSGTVSFQTPTEQV